jgi:glutathione peroxidase
MSIYHVFVKKPGSSSSIEMSNYKDNVILIVNVASQCGFTEQYQSLQRLYDKFSEKSFSILAFPCNDFLSQEPGSDEEIIEFCDRNYGVTFDVFEKVIVRGVNAHSLYNFLQAESFPVIRPKGVKSKFFKFFTCINFWRKELKLPTSGDVLWNFHKFVIGKNGQIIGHFSSDCDPFEPKLIACIESELKDNIAAK